MIIKVAEKTNSSAFDYIYYIKFDFDIAILIINDHSFIDTKSFLHLLYIKLTKFRYDFYYDKIMSKCLKF